MDAALFDSCSMVLGPDHFHTGFDSDSCWLPILAAQGDHFWGPGAANRQTAWGVFRQKDLTEKYGGAPREAQWSKAELLVSLWSRFRDGSKSLVHVGSKR